jgi:hypothetical protein
VKALPTSSTATQKLELGHDTEVSSPSRPEGDDHECPLYVTQPPSSSTATQKLALGHDTEVTTSLGTMTEGGDHDVPL